MLQEYNVFSFPIYLMKVFKASSESDTRKNG